MLYACPGNEYALSWNQTIKRKQEVTHNELSFLASLHHLACTLALSLVIVHKCFHILLYTSVYFCILLYTSVYFCILLYTSVHFCILLYTSVYFCTLLHTSVHFCILLYTSVYFCILLYTFVYSPPF